MAPLRVLAFDHEGRPVAFDTWHDDLQLYLLSDIKDSVSLFDHVSGVAPAPPAAADGGTRSQWLSRDATARLAIRNYLPHLLAAETSAVVVGAARGTPRPPFFEGCSPSPLSPSFASASAADVSVPEDVGAASTSAKRRSSKGKGGRGGGGGSGGGGHGSGSGGGGSGGGVGGGGGGGGGGTGGGNGGSGSGGGGNGGSDGGGGGGSSGGSSGPRCGGPGGGQRQHQQRRSETLSPQQLREWLVQRGTGGGSETCPYVIRTGVRAGQTCGKFHTEHGCFSRLDDAWHAQFGDDVERPRWAELLRSGVAIFDLDYDAIISAMYVLSFSAEGDCYRCVPPDPGIAAAALGASASGTPPGTAPAEALHTFTLDSGASRCFFRDSTTLTPLPAPVPVRVADPSGGPVVARSSTVLPCPAVPSGSLSGLHLPSISTNLVSTAALQDAMVTTTTLRGQRVSICTCTRTGRHLATFTRRPGSSLYTVATGPPQVAVSAQVSASGQVAASCSCRLLSHQTLLWHHRLGHPSLPRLRGMHSRLLVSSLPRSLPPLPPSLAPPCLPCVEGRQRAAPHSSSFPLTIAPLQTLHMDVWGPARVTGQGRECYFLLVVEDYTRYTTVFPLRSKGEVVDVLIPWIRTVRLQLRERFGTDLPVLCLHSDSGGEFSSDLLRDFCRGEGILLSFTLPDNPQQNGIAERRIGLVMEVARTSMIHAAAPHFLSPFAVRYAAHQLNLWHRVSLPETSPTLRWTEKVGNASVFRVWGSRAFVCDTSTDKLSARAIPCVFLGFVPDAPGSQFYHPTSRRVLPSQDVTFDKSVPSAESEGVAPLSAASSGAPGAGGAGDTRDGGAAVTTGAGGTGGTAATGPGCARTSGAGAAGTSGVGCAGAGDPTEPGAAGAGGAGAGGAGVGGPGAGGAGGAGAGAVDPSAGGARGTMRPRPYFVPLLQQSGGLTERCAPASRPVSRVCTARRAPRLRPPTVPGTHAMALRPSSVPLRVPLTSPPESSLPEVLDPTSNCTRAASPTVSRLLATAVTDPSFESAAASALVAELLDFAAPCRLDYAFALVVGSVSASPPSVGGECALGTDVLEDRQEDFECLAAVASMVLAPEGDLDAPDIPTPRSYAEVITVDGMWIFRVKRPPGSPPAFKARYVARGFSQRQEVDYFHTFSPTPKMTTLRVFLHVAAQRDYELHSLDFSTAFLQGSLHEEIWLRRPLGFTGSFPAGTQWSLRQRVYGLRQAPREWHDTLRPTLAALGFAPSTTDPSLFLRTDTSLQLFYVLVYVDDLVFATADTEALTLVKSELQKRHTCTDMGELRSYLGLQITRDRARRTITLTQSHMVQQVLQRFGFQFSSPQPTPLSTSHSLSTPPSDESVEPSGPYPELVCCLITSGMGLVLGGRGPVVLTGHAHASWVDDSATQRSSPGYTFSLGATLAHLPADRLGRVASFASSSQRGQLRLAYVATRANFADVFTKALPPSHHQRFATVLGLVPTLPHLLTA
ncbi:unnamed protein product [Closterium sp. NIES-54]